MGICTLTKQASDQVNKICNENSIYAVSLNLKGGGCAGFEYEWESIDTADQVEPGDIVISTGTGNFVIGSASVMFLAGTEVDYVQSIVGSNFEIRNPNAKSSCGCGVSVNFDLEELEAPPVDNLAYQADNGVS